MTDEQNTIDSTESATAWRPSKRSIAIAAAIVAVLAGGITAVTVTNEQAEAAETTRRCDVAVKGAGELSSEITAALEAAEAAVLATDSTDLPGDEGWQSRPYAEADAGVEKLGVVAGHVETLEAVDIDTACETREDAAALDAEVSEASSAITPP